MIKEITSAKNETYKFIKSLKTKKARTKSGKYIVEGIKSVGDAIAAGADIDFIVFSSDFEKVPENYPAYRVAAEIFSGLCDTETPQGIMAVLNIPERNQICGELCLFCDRITDPGNMGTIIRICDAVGCSLLLSEGCVDIYNPKTVRASMGSFFHTNIVLDVQTDELIKLKDDGWRIIGGALSENIVDYRKEDYSGKTVIVVGNEANGIGEEILSLCDALVKIQIWGEAESLNVGVAAALLLYEAKRNQE